MSTKKTTATEVEETAAVTAAEEVAATAATAETAAAAEPMAYLGPDLKNVAINGTVYIGGLPAALQAKIKEVPAIKGLIIPISSMATAGVAIRTQGTALNNLYNAVSAKLQEQQKNR